MNYTISPHQVYCVFHIFLNKIYSLYYTTSLLMKYNIYYSPRQGYHIFFPYYELYNQSTNCT